MQDAPDSKAKDMVDTFLKTYPDLRVSVSIPPEASWSCLNGAPPRLSHTEVSQSNNG